MDKYKQFILDIIINRGRFSIPDGEYKERHHIIPKCMGGSDDEENLVDLYAKEHLVAHKLLADIYPCHHKVQHAFNKMLDYKKYDGALSPAEYERAKKKKSEAMSNALKEYYEKHPEKNPMKRPEVAAKFKGKNNPNPAKMVEALNPKTGERVCCFESTRDAGRAGFNRRHVYNCCNGKRKTHKNFIWRYVEEVSDNDGDN